MGQAISTPGAAYGVTYSANDYQLAIELTKELEHVLLSQLGAEGRGLHERLSAVEAQLPKPTVRAIRYLASQRNALIHDRTVRAIEDRTKFIGRFESAMSDLRVVICKKNAVAYATANDGPPSCIVS